MVIAISPMLLIAFFGGIFLHGAAMVLGWTQSYDFVRQHIAPNSQTLEVTIMSIYSFILLLVSIDVFRTKKLVPW